jgi:hypothetical protein
MAGDVNLFLSQENEEETDSVDKGDKVAASNREPLQYQAEIDIMIAEEKYRRKGLGREATCLMMHFITTHINIRRIFCKIKASNKASLQLFKSLSFVQCAYAECFGEVELELKRSTNQELVQLLGKLNGSTSVHSLECLA